MILNSNKMKKLQWLILIMAVSLTITSCQKVINIDLNSASPAIVIVGNINDQPGPYTVTLSQTVNFSDPNTFPAVSGAFVTIADNAGNTDTLTEVSAGVYHTKKIMGVAGRTYILTVVANGQTYTATSTMPAAVPFDTLVLAKVTGFRNGGKNDSNILPQAVFKDPAGLGNYYRFIETRNDTLLSNIYVLNDQHRDGLYVNYTLREDTTLHSNDSVRIEMQCIDNGTYQYFHTFNEASGSTNVTPSNPVSNISNNALGYFSAHTSRYKALKVP